MKAYPTETAIFILSHEENIANEDVDANIKQIIGNQCISDRSDGVKKLTVGEIRGKLVVLLEVQAERNLVPNGDDGTND